MGQCVPKHWHLNYRCQGIAQKKAYDVLTHLIFITCDLLTWRFNKYFQKRKTKRKGGSAVTVHL
jgi:hypothetical protein